MGQLTELKDDLQHQTLDWSDKQVSLRSQQAGEYGPFLQGSSIRNKATPIIFHLGSPSGNFMPWKRISLGHENIPGLCQGLLADSIARLYPQEKG